MEDTDNMSFLTYLQEQQGNDYVIEQGYNDMPIADVIELELEHYHDYQDSIYPMSLRECFEDKKVLINMLMQDYVLSLLFDAIEEDENYSLSTDENIQLCHDLVKMWVEKEY